MTKKDFQVIADAFAYCEEHIEQDRGANGDEATDVQLEQLRWTVEKMGEHLAIGHPRFQMGLFEIASMPIAHRRLRDEIVAKLG